MHRAQQHRTWLSGVEARTCVSTRSFPRHAHDQFGIGVMLAGAHRTWSGVGHVEPQAGDVIATNPGEMHDGAPLGERPRAWRMLYIDTAVVGGLLQHEAEVPEITRPALRDPRLARLVTRAFERMIAGPDAALGAEEDLVRSLVRTVRPAALRAPPPPAVRRARQMMEDAPEATHSLAVLAGVCGISRFQLLRGFARELGLTPHRYLVQLRLAVVRRRLAGGDKPAEAALAAGFADQSHMTRAFVRQFGVTPGAYRAARA